MRRELLDAMRQLGAQSKHLNAQWQRSLSLAASLSLLNDIQAVVQIPERIDAAVLEKVCGCCHCPHHSYVTLRVSGAEQDWPNAVQLLLEAGQRLAREEMREVGALRKLRGDLGSLCRCATSSAQH